MRPSCRVAVTMGLSTAEVLEWFKRGTRAGLSVYTLGSFDRMGGVQRGLWDDCG